MALVLRKPAHVAGDGDGGGKPLKVIPAGTPVTEIPPSELAQLCHEHFGDTDTKEWAAPDHPELTDDVGRLAREAAAAAEGGES